MSIRTASKYAFGLVFTRFMPLNDDQTTPTVSRMIGGVGTFDFSEVDDNTAVALKVKVDNGTVEELTVDVSGAVDTSAVTVDELVGFLNTTFTGAGTELAASKDATTNRIKLENTNTASVPDYIQVYDEAAEIALFGQGFGLKFVISDTLQSIGETPTLKDEETFTTTDAKGRDTEVLSDGYRKGFTATVVDTAEDWELRALIEGGTYDETTKEYDAPDNTSTKLYFYVEAYYQQFSEGTNKEANEAGYVKKLYRSCKGSAGDQSHERAFAQQNYSITGTTYTDENGITYPDTKLKFLTSSEYEALDVYNV